MVVGEKACRAHISSYSSLAKTSHLMTPIKFCLLWACVAMLTNAIARTNALSCQLWGSQEKVPHLLPFHKFRFLSGLLSDKMPEELTNQLFSVNSPVAWSCSILSAVVWCHCLRTSRALAIGLALTVMQIVSDSVLHSLGNCCSCWPSEVVVVSHWNTKMCLKPITEATMSRRVKLKKSRQDL